MFISCWSGFFKNLVKNGLKVAYENDESLKKCFRQIFIFSLIPPEHIDVYWINTIMPSMLNLKIKYPKISNFNEYIVNTYFVNT